MIQSQRIVLGTILLLGLFFAGCKKQRIEHKYCGDFIFTVQSHNSSISNGTHDTTYTVEGNIVLSDLKPNGLPENDVYVQINYLSPGYGAISSIDRKGNLYYPGLSGKFTSKDELDFTNSATGLSSSFTHTVHGVRK